MSRQQDLFTDPVQTLRLGKIIKASDDFGFVLAPILVPEEIDLQGDVISADDIEQASHNFMETSQAGGFMHRKIMKEIVMVESSIVRSETTINGVILKAGTWLGAWRIRNQDLRDLIKAGSITGVSIGGTGVRIPLEE